MELKDRIPYILQNNPVKPGISEYEFARSVKTYSSKFSEIRSGKVKTLSPTVALEISKKYNVNFKWLLTGIGEPFEKEFNYENNCYNIPIRGDVEASMGSGVTVYSEEQTGTYAISTQLVKDLGISPNNTEIIFARGDSMYPTIESGDSLLINHSETEIYDGLIYCVRIDGQLYAKRLQKLPPATVKVVSDNTAKYDPFYIDFSKQQDFDFKIIGRVCWWGRIAK